jgi:hypothetical protein
MEAEADMQPDFGVAMTPISFMVGHPIGHIRRRLETLSEFADSGQPEVRHGPEQRLATAAP